MTNNQQLVEKIKEEFEETFAGKFIVIKDGRMWKFFENASLQLLQMQTEERMKESFDLVKAIKLKQRLSTEKEGSVYNEAEKREVENYTDWKYGYDMATEQALNLVTHFLQSLKHDK